MKPFHKTRDVYLASYLLSEEAELAGVKRLGPKTVEVCFVAEWRLHELIRLYWSGTPISLVPSRLFKALQTLKSRSRCRR